MDNHDFSNEGIILVLGVTGAGKSYFLNQLKSHSVKEGHGLKSETAKCEAVQILLDDKEKRSITVVDTPGFDDTARSHGEILAEISQFLAAQYALGVPLRGVLYLHKITDNKMTGSSLTYLNLLQSLVGDEALENLVLVTSMWNLIRDENRGQAVKREQDLIDNYWAPMQKGGSYVTKFDGTTESAFSLVYRLAGQESVVLEVQRQIMDDDQSVLDTSAGTDLARTLETDIETYQLKVERLEAQLQGELKAQPRNKERIRRLREEKAQVAKLLGLMTESIDRMKVRPGSTVKQRIRQALRERGRDAAFILATVLHITLTVVQLGLGG